MSAIHSEVGSIPIVIDPNVPLVAAERDEYRKRIEGTSVPVLFWVIQGRIHVHPDRLEEFRVHITNSKLAPYAKTVTG